MKKIKNIFRITAVVAMMAFAVIWGIMYSPDVKATPQINITYDVYKKADYDVRVGFKTTYGYDYETAKYETSIYEQIVEDPSQVYWNTTGSHTYASKYGSLYSNQAMADAWWSGALINTAVAENGNVKKAPAVTLYATLGTANATCTYYDAIEDDNVSYTLKGKGKTYADVKASVNVYEAAKPKTVFAPGDTIVIVPNVQGDYLGHVELCFDMLFPNATGTSNLFDVTNDFATLKARNEMYSLENQSWAADSTLTQPFVVNNVNVDHQFIIDGGNFAQYANSQALGSSSDVINIFNIELKISGSANGNYPIDIGNSTRNVWTRVNGDEDTQQYNYPSTFNSTPTIIAVQGASEKAECSSISVGSGSATKQSGGIEIGGTTYDYWKASSQTVSTSSVNILPVPAESGTVQTVRYSTNLNTVLSGGIVTPSSGTYSIPLGATGTTTYVAIQIQPQKAGAASKWTILEIPKDSYTQAYLTGFTVDSIVTTSGAGSPSLSPAFVANSTTQKNYTISVPQDTTSITFTPHWDTTTYKMTAKHGSKTITSGTAITTNDVTSDIEIEVKAQDGTHAITYTFAIAKLSNDNSLSLSVTGYQGLAFDSSDTCTINNVPFKTSSLSYTASNSAGATITVTGSTADINGTPKSLTLLTDGNNAKQTQLDIDVKAQSGISKTYHLLVNR